MPPSRWTPARKAVSPPLVTPTQRQQAAVELLEAVEADARPADAVISAWFRARRDLGEQDRGELSELVYEALRHHARLGWLLARRGRSATARDRLQLLLSGGDIDHPEMPEEVRAECPGWALEPLRLRFGGSFAREMAAMLAPAPLDLRVNPLKASREAVLAGLARLRIRAEASARAPQGVRIAQRPSLSRLPMLKDGAAEIQDEGSQLVALMLDAQPGDRVVDFCAGAGGKTLAIASQMLNKGAVIACDVSEGRLKRAAERFRHAGLHNIQTRLLASERDKWVKRHKAGFDRVLVDAPCSGTGTWRRNPDARCRSDGYARLLPLQANILDSAARLVKPGGRLVYATCSLLPDENEAQVEAFLAAHPDFHVVPQAVVTDSAHPAYLSLTPARHGTDGFFAAALQRRAPTED